MKSTIKFRGIITIAVMLMFSFAACENGNQPCSHTWVEGSVITAAACETEGLVNLICSRCKIAGEQKTIAALGHEWDNEAGIQTEAKCTTAKGLVRSCQRSGCGYAENVGTTGDPLGHDESGPEANCTTDKVCLRLGCGFVLTAALGHDESGAVANCTTAKVCVRPGCGFVLTAALGHQSPSGTPATCTENGNTGTGACLRGCGVIITGTVIPALGHDWKKSGNEYICSRCGITKKDGDSIENAIVLTENIWEDGELTATKNEQWFSFTATASTQYIHFNPGTSDDVFVAVYNSGGSAVGSETNLYKLYSGPLNTSRTLTVGQTYYIKVRPYSSTDIGTYQIGFNKTNLSFPFPPSAIPLTENIWADGNFSIPNSFQWFSFTATASTQYIHFNRGTFLLNEEVWVEVYNSGGILVGSETYLYGSILNTSRTVTVGQTYYIRIKPNSASETGTYKIAFNQSTTPPL